MVIVPDRPAVDGLPEALDALRGWQDEGAPFQLHPGDLGWFWRFGAGATAAAVRTWRRDGRIVALGLHDGPALLRLAIAPRSRRDEELARGLADAGTRLRCPVEAPAGALVHDLLSAAGWGDAEPWTPLRRDLTVPVGDPGVRIETVGPPRAAERCAVQRAAFDNSTFTPRRWRAMAGGPAYADARCLVAHDARGTAVAAVTVWSAGAGRPGLIEPMGVHREHRRQGYGTAICVAAAGALRDLGASSALVATPSANVGGVATYRAAGFRALAEVRDRRPG